MRVFFKKLPVKITCRCIRERIRIASDAIFLKEVKRRKACTLHIYESLRWNFTDYERQLTFNLYFRDPTFLIKELRQCHMSNWVVRLLIIFARDLVFRFRFRLIKYLNRHIIYVEEIYMIAINCFYFRFSERCKLYEVCINQKCSFIFHAQMLFRTIFTDKKISKIWAAKNSGS